MCFLLCSLSLTMHLSPCSPLPIADPHSGQAAVVPYTRPPGGAPPAHRPAGHRIRRSSKPQTAHHPQSVTSRNQLQPASFDERTDHSQHPVTNQQLPSSHFLLFLFVFFVCHQCGYVISSDLDPSCHRSASASSSGGRSTASNLIPTDAEPASSSSPTLGSPQAAPEPSSLPPEAVAALDPGFGHTVAAGDADRAGAACCRNSGPDALPEPPTSSDSGC